MDDRAAWLQAQLDEDSRWAENHQDPDGLIEACRAILELHAPFEMADSLYCATCGELGMVEWPCPTVRFIAAAYEGEDGYQEMWRPNP